MTTILFSALFFLCIFSPAIEAVRIDQKFLCPTIEFDYSAMTEDSAKLQSALNSWKTLNLTRLPGQDAVWRGRPVFQITAANLKSLVRTCTKLQGTLVEIHDHTENAQLIQVMLELKMTSIIFNLNFIKEEGLLRWSASNIPFYMPNLDQSVSTRPDD